VVGAWRAISQIEGGTAVKCNVPVAGAIIGEAVLSERVQEALGQLVGAAREGVLALSVEVGLSVRASCWRLRSTRWSDRRARGTRTGPRSGMVTRTAR
jgi:hypothetical protein